MDPLYLYVGVLLVFGGPRSLALNRIDFLLL